MVQPFFSSLGTAYDCIFASPNIQGPRTYAQPGPFGGLESERDSGRSRRDQRRYARHVARDVTLSRDAFLERVPCHASSLTCFYHQRVMDLAKLKKQLAADLSEHHLDDTILTECE
jgi:hypothetical protein